MIRNIIFDWSGTLVDDLPGVFKATNYILEQAGVATLTLAEFRAEFELPFTGFYNRFTPDVPLEQLEVWFHSYFGKVCGEVIALPHAAEFLDFCKSKELRCFVLSAVKQEYFTEQTANVGMSDCFEQTYLGVWDKREKIHDIIEENNLSKDETLYIGDMQHDVETAHHGGIHSCALLTGYNTLDQLREANPTHIATDLDEFKGTLQANGMTLPSSKRRPVATVGALIYDALGQVLMVRTDKWSGKWGIPGGKIEHSESSEDALRREIAEETSLTITDIEFVLSQDCIDSEEFYRPEHFILLNYTCRVAGEADVTLNDEAQAYRWVSEPDALQLDLNRPTRILLDTVMANATIPAMPDRITIEDLEVRFHVGVPDEERTEPQRLLITIELTHDLGASGTADSLAETIDYFAVCQAVKALGQMRSWKLIESLADDICMLVLDRFSPSVVRVVVKKFILPDTRWVSVEMIRPAKNRQDSDR